MNRSACLAAEERGRVQSSEAGPPRGGRACAHVDVVGGPQRDQRAVHQAHHVRRGRALVAQLERERLLLRARAKAADAPRRQRRRGPRPGTAPRAFGAGRALGPPAHVRANVPGARSARGAPAQGSLLALGPKHAARGVSRGHRVRKLQLHRRWQRQRAQVWRGVLLRERVDDRVRQAIAPLHQRQVPCADRRCWPLALMQQFT